MYVFLAVLIITVIVAIALVAAGNDESLPEAYPDRRYLELPSERALRPNDLEELRLAVVFRGYRMDEVDHLLDRLAFELEMRDARIAELEEAVASVRSLRGPGAQTIAADGAPVTP